MNYRDAFFKDMAIALDTWVKTVSKSLISPDEDLIWTDNQEFYYKFQSLLAENKINQEDIEKILKECFMGLSHSFLNILDGSSQISNKGKKLFLVDEDNNDISGDLHYQFAEYINRIKRVRVK